MKTECPPELHETLRRYLVLQQEEQRLREEKKTLQAHLARYMTSQGLPLWYPEVDGRPLKVRHQSSTRIEYDEPLLRQRLGTRYSAILAPDWRKIRARLADLDRTLQPHLDIIGSPSPDRVRFAVEQKLVAVSDFEGAFRKITQDRIAVSVFRQPGEEPAEPSPDGEPA